MKFFQRLIQKLTHGRISELRSDTGRRRRKLLFEQFENRLLLASASNVTLTGAMNQHIEFDLSSYASYNASWDDGGDPTWGCHNPYEGPIDENTECWEEGWWASTANASIGILSGPTHGSLDYAYEPDMNFSGTDSFDYFVCDNDEQQPCSSATVTLIVDSSNNPSLDEIPDPAPIDEDSGVQQVDLSGIVDGASGWYPLWITATSSNPGLIPDPTVDYTSPNTTGSLFYTPQLNQFGSATITVAVNNIGPDGGLGNGDDLKVLRIFTVTVNPVNHPPTLDAIGDPWPTTPSPINTSYPYNIYLTGITAGPGESEDVDVTAVSNNTSLIPDPTITYQGDYRSGGGYVLTYIPIAGESGTATITVTVRDAFDSQVSQTFTVVVNDAPVLHGSNNLAAISEDDTTNSGTLVSAILAGNVTDIDSGAASGIAVIGVENSNGYWQYTTDGGASWSDFGGEYWAVGRLLASDENTRVRFVPNANWSGTVEGGIIFRAWDQTSGDAGGLYAILWPNAGGSTAWSAATSSASIVVNPVNDPPTLNAIANQTIDEDAALQTLDLAGVSAGGGEVQALTVTATSSNTNLIPDPAVVYTSPNSTGSLRYTPAANQNGSATITVTVRDAGLAALSQTFTVTVNPVNDAPVLIGAHNLTAINEDEATNNGTLVSAIISGQVTDVDTGSLSGIAVTAVDNSNGHWQYSQYRENVGLLWWDFGSPSPNAARLLAADTNTGVRFVPNANWNGIVSGGITFRAWDRTSGVAGNTANVSVNGGTTAYSSATASANIIVNAVNDGPVAANDTFTIIKNTPRTFDVLANDTDVDGDNLTPILVTPAHGALTLNSNGSFTYTPVTGYTGSDSFTYQANDGHASSFNTASVALTIVSQAIYATDDAIVVTNDTTRTVEAPGVLANDIDWLGLSLTATQLTNVAHGALQFNSDGSYVYTPDAHYTGTDSFTYSASDGQHSSDATVTISIPTGLVSHPVFSVDQPDFTWEPGPQLTNLSNITSVGSVVYFTTVGPDHFYQLWRSDGTYYGTNMVQYTGTDWTKGVALTNVNGTLFFLGNDTVHGIELFKSDGTTNGTGMVKDILPGQDSSNPNNLVNVNGTLFFTADDGIHGLELWKSDGTADGTVLVKDICPGSDSGITGTSLFENVNGTLFFTASDGDGRELWKSDGTAAGTTMVSYLDDDPDFNSLTAVNGTLYFTEFDGNWGAGRGTQLWRSDGTASGTMMLKDFGRPVSSLTAVDNYLYFSRNTVSTSAELWKTDGTVNGTTLVKDIWPGSNGSLGGLTNVNGTLFFGANDGTHGGELWTSNGFASGTYRISGGAGDITFANGTFLFNSGGYLYETDGSAGNAANLHDGADRPQTVLWPSPGVLNGQLFFVASDVDYGPFPRMLANDYPPSASDDSYTLDEDTVLHSGTSVLANDSDQEYISILLSALLESGPAHGSLTLSWNGSFVYTPNPNYSGTDSFTYRVSDDHTKSNIATVSIYVRPVNDPPVAVDDNNFNSLKTDEDSTLTISISSLVANDIDVDGDALTAVPLAGPTHGTLTPNGNGSFIYTPLANYNGSDSFTYQANDGHVNSNNIATVSLTITPVNDAPMAIGDTSSSFTTAEDTALTISASSLVAKYIDVDGDALMAVPLAGPTHGTLVPSGTGSFIYTPFANYNGSDSFTYQTNDGHVNSNDIATVSLTITPVNDPPVAVDDSFAATQNKTRTWNAPGVFANDFDVDHDNFTASVVMGPTHGALLLNSDGSFTYTPVTDYLGPDSFTYKINDGHVDSSNVATVSLTVNPNQAPLTVADTYITGYETSLSVNASGVLANDIDVDDDSLTAILDTNPAHGTLTLSPDGSFYYVPPSAFHGPDTFTYHNNDGHSDGNVTVVTIQVSAPTPVIVVPATASEPNVTGMAVELSVGATVEGDASNLIYTWSVTSLPGGVFVPQLSDNDSVTADDITATFTAAGTYTFEVTIDNDGSTITSEVTVTVQQTPTSIHVSPPIAFLQNGSTRQFTATVEDQFGNDIQNPPSISWAIASGIGSISGGGLYTAPSTGSSEVKVDVEAGDVTTTVNVEVTGQTNVINFDDLASGVVLTNQYAQATFSGDPAYPYIVIGETDASLPNFIGAPSAGGNPFNHPLYVDFTLPVNDLHFLQMRDDAAAGTTIAEVRIFENGSLSSTVAIHSTGGIHTPGDVDLSAYHNVTRIEIVNVTDPAGLLYDDFRFTAQTSQLTAHRTGDFQGQEVSDEIKGSGDPSKYVILTDNDYLMADGTSSLAADHAEIPDENAGAGDNDLAKFTLKKLVSGSHGKIKIVLSDPSAVRLFTSDGSLLFAEGTTNDDVLTLDLSSPSGYLAGLQSDDLDIWVEGIHGDPDFDIAVLSEDNSGKILSHDDIHMAIADWTFRNYDGEPMNDVDPMWGQALLNEVDLVNQLGIQFQVGEKPEDYFFKNFISGLPNGVQTQLRVTSDDEPSDTYDDNLVQSSGTFASQDFAALYGSEDELYADPDPDLTAAQRQAIKDVLGLNVVHNPGQNSTLKTGPADNPTDSHTRNIAIRPSFNIVLNNPDGIYHVGDHIIVTVTSPSPTKYRFAARAENVPDRWTENAERWSSPGYVTSYSFDVVAGHDGFGRITVAGQDGRNVRDPFHEDGQSILVWILPQNQSPSQWQLAAWQGLRVNGLVPGDPINRNRQITSQYTAMFNSNPQAFEWAGMAAFASKLAGDSMARADYFYTLGEVGTFVGGPDPDKLLPYLGEGNLAIYLDMYPQLLAYQAGGIANIQAMNLTNPVMLDAWTDIDDGVNSGDTDKIFEGSLLFARVEQTETLQAVIEKDPTLWSQVTFFRLNPWAIVSPMPGDNSTFQTFAPGTSFGNGWVRFAWFKTIMVPAWQEWRKTHNSIDLQTLLNGGYKE